MAIRDTSQHLRGIHLRIATSSIVPLTCHVIPSASEGSQIHIAGLLIKMIGDTSLRISG